MAIFVTVVEAGSFAAAARKLNSSRSRVSEQVAQLEAAAGMRLLHRSTRQLALTSEGEKVYAKAKILPELIHEIEAVASPAEPSGRVAISTTHDIAIKHLIPVLNEFQRRYPKVQVDLIISDQKLDLIAEQIDIAIRIGLPNDDSLIGRVMYEERSALYASPAYLKEHGRPKTLGELAQHKWVVISQMSQNGEQSLIYQGKPVHINPAYYQLTNSPLVAQSLTLAGHGISTLLPVTVKDECKAGLLVPIGLGVSAFSAVFTLVYPSRKQVPARTRVLIDYLLEVRMFG
ncbi:hypothetical transcriptional regulator [Marinomonas sp. MED121]|nr:hypothetical transcriptional regulator [Marinomonas sp. MED121]